MLIQQIPTHKDKIDWLEGTFIVERTIINPLSAKVAIWCHIIVSFKVLVQKGFIEIGYWKLDIVDEMHQ